MPNRSEKVYGYISKPLKERMDKIEQCDPDYTMSRIVMKGVERVVSELEHEFFGAPSSRPPTRGALKSKRATPSDLARLRGGSRGGHQTMM